MLGVVYTTPSYPHNPSWTPWDKLYSHPPFSLFPKAWPPGLASPYFVSLQLELTVRSSLGLTRRSLRPTPQCQEIKNLIVNFHHLKISTGSEFFVPVTPEQAYHTHFPSPTFTSPDLPFIPGGFVHSTSCHTKPIFPSQYHSPDLDSPSPLTPLTSLLSQNFSPSSSILSNLIPSLSLLFLFNPSFFPLISDTNPLSPLFTPSESSFPSTSLLHIPISLLPSILSFSINPIPPPANQVQIRPPAMAQQFQMPLNGTPNAPKFNGKMPFKLPQYLEDIDFLKDSARLNNAKKIKVALNYTALDEAEVWQTLPEASTNPAD